MVEKIEKIRGAAVYGDEIDLNDPECLPYVELALITDSTIERAHKVLTKYNYEVTEEHDCEGSDYPSYCIWFKDKE